VLDKAGNRIEEYTLSFKGNNYQDVIADLSKVVNLADSLAVPFAQARDEAAMVGVSLVFPGFIDNGSSYMLPSGAKTITVALEKMFAMPEAPKGLYKLTGPQTPPGVFPEIPATFVDMAKEPRLWSDLTESLAKSGWFKGEAVLHKAPELRIGPTLEHSQHGDRAPGPPTTSHSPAPHQYRIESIPPNTHEATPPSTSERPRAATPQ